MLDPKKLAKEAMGDIQKASDSVATMIESAQNEKEKEIFVECEDKLAKCWVLLLRWRSGDF